MTTRPPRTLLPLGALALSACFVDAPATGGATGETSGASEAATSTSTSTSGSSSTGAATSEASTDEATSSTSTSTSATTSTSTTTTTTTTTSTSTSTTTGGGLMTVIEADVGVCVLLALDGLPYIGPAECTERADISNGTAATGLMIVDSAFTMGGGGREARIFLRFTIPAELADATISGLTLGLHVADGASAGGPSGSLRQTDPFDLGALDLGTPASLKLLAPSVTVAPEESVDIELDPALALAGQPLYLGLWEAGDDGTIFFGHAAEQALRPTLTILHD